MDVERDRQIEAILVGSKPEDFVAYLNRASVEKILKDLGETGELIKLLKDDPKYSPVEKYTLYRNANHLIKVYAKLKGGDRAEELFEQTSYEFYATNEGVKILRCDEVPGEGWLLIT